MKYERLIDWELFMKKKKSKLHSLSWFKKRIGLRIFRDAHSCCNSCDDVAKNGLIIHDLAHADSLYWYQNDYGNEGIILNYRDKL
jgi:hypothetical protein|tara:strand:- start:511 stop:765 length:255 start_codon:yes stop_codon:yes gene_type:complete